MPKFDQANNNPDFVQLPIRSDGLVCPKPQCDLQHDQRDMDYWLLVHQHKQLCCRLGGVPEFVQTLDNSVHRLPSTADRNHFPKSYRNLQYDQRDLDEWFVDNAVINVR